MKGRVFPTLLVMGIGAALAAAAQEFCWPNSSFSAGAARVPWLVGAAAYYAVCREWPWGLVAALWYGLVADGLCGVPPGPAALPLAGAAWLWHRKLRIQMRPGAAAAALFAAAVAPVAAFLAYAWLRFFDGLPPAGPAALVEGVLAAAPLGAFAAFAAHAVLRALDARSCNVDIVAEERRHGSRERW